MIFKKNIGWIAFIVIGTLLYTWMSYKVGANSDNMSSLLISKDIVDGNHRLYGWAMSTQSYIFSDIIWTALAIKCFGYYPLLAHIMPAIFYALMVSFAAKLASHNHQNGWIFLLPTLFFPTIFTTANAIELNIHGGIYLFSLMGLFLLRDESRKNWLTLSFFVFFSGILAYSDKLIIYIFILPLMLSSLIFMVIYKRIFYLQVLISTIASILFYRIIQVYLDSYFLYNVPGIGSNHLADLEALKNNFSWFYHGVLQYFSIADDTPKNNISIILNIFRIFMMLMFIYLALSSIIKRWNKSFIDLFLIFGMSMPIGAFLISNMAVDANSSRFFFCSLIFSSILIGRSYNPGKNLKYYLILLFIWGLSNVTEYRKLNESPDSYYNRLGIFLNKEKLTKGYSPFWTASVETVYGHTSIAPIDNILAIKPMKWLSKDEWYNDSERNFIMSFNIKDLTKAEIQFGKPLKKLEFEGMYISVWDKLPLPPNGFSLLRLDREMIPSQVGEFKDGAIWGNRESGFLLFGPYIPLNKGNYILTIEGAGSQDGDTIEVVDNTSSVILLESSLTFDKQGEFISPLSVYDSLQNIEVRIKTNGNPSLVVKGYSIIKK